MRRVPDCTARRTGELTDLNALVLAEIESLGQVRAARPPQGPPGQRGGWRPAPRRQPGEPIQDWGEGAGPHWGLDAGLDPNPDPDPDTDPDADLGPDPDPNLDLGRAQDRRRDRVQTQATAQAQGRGRPATRLRVDTRDRRPQPRTTGEEAEGLFDEPLDFAGLGEGSAGQDPGDGPNDSELLCPEERAFVERAVGFLAARPTADLILDRIWSALTDARPDGFYDPDDLDPCQGPPGPAGPDRAEPLDGPGLAGAGPQADPLGESSGPRAGPAPRAKGARVALASPPGGRVAPAGGGRPGPDRGPDRGLDRGQGEAQGQARGPTPAPAE
jgi:hypothetical protein